MLLNSNNLYFFCYLGTLHSEPRHIDCFAEVPFSTVKGKERFICVRICVVNKHGFQIFENYSKRVANTKNYLRIIGHRQERRVELQIIFDVGKNFGEQI